MVVSHGFTSLNWGYKYKCFDHLTTKHWDLMGFESEFDGIHQQQ
jgi:hypothetical protein